MHTALVTFPWNVDQFDKTSICLPAHTTWDSAAAAATEKEAFRSRLRKSRRLLNNRKGSLSATNKNAEANDRAYDMKQKTIQALYTLAEEYSTLEATMKKVTSEMC